MKLTTMFAVALICALVAGQRGQPPQAAPEDTFAPLVRTYLWATSDSARRDAEAMLTADATLTATSRERFHDVEEAMRRGRASYPPPPERVNGRFPVVEFTVDVPGGPPVPVFVQLPSRYDPRADWPLMFAMHGGPP